MTCKYCGSLLPEGAMFCGECGRSVALTRHNIAPAAAQALRSDPTVLPEAPAHSGVDVAAPAAQPESELSPQDSPVEPEPEAQPDPEREQASVEPAAAVAPVAPTAAPVPSAAVAPSAAPAPQPAAPALQSAAPAPPPVAPRPSSPFAPVQRPVGLNAQLGASQNVDHVDVEPTRLTKSEVSGDRFILQFSTGESVTVFGTGLVGRNPNPEPGEYFDHRVLILDPTRSVSKTHLEFGQTAGEFWINDRFSGNGSGIRPPDAPRVPCTPGKRYMVARGSRVDIGEQFFIVS